MTEIPNTLGPIPATGTLGVGSGVGDDCDNGRGVAVATTQLQSVSFVQDAFLQRLSQHTRLFVQSLLVSHDWLHFGGGVAVAVGNGVLVGVVVGVNVRDGVPVGVSVAVAVAVGGGELIATVNGSVHAGSAAFGIACGTVGATGFLTASF